MICMTQNRRPLVRIRSQQHFLEVAFFSLFQKTFVNTHGLKLVFVVSSMVADMSVFKAVCP